MLNPPMVIKTCFCTTLVALLATTLVCNAQFKTSDLIEVDTITGSLSKSLPFDQPFTLKRTYNYVVKPISFEVYEVSKSGRLKSTPIRTLVKMSLERDEYIKPKLYELKDLDRFTKYKRKVKKYYKELYRQGYHFPVNYVDRHKFTINNKDNKVTELYMNVPMLKPRREYRFIINTEGNTYVNQLYYKAGKLIAESQAKVPGQDQASQQAATAKQQEATQNFNALKNSIKSKALGNPKLLYINNAEIVTNDYTRDLSRLNISLPRFTTDILHVVEVSLIRGTKLEDLNNSNGNLLPSYPSVDVRVNNSYPLDLTDLKDSKGNYLMSGKSYCFVFKQNNQINGSLELKVSKAHIYDGNMFEVNNDDLDPDHNFPVEISISALSKYGIIDQKDSKIYSEVDSFLNSRTSVSGAMKQFDESLDKLLRVAYTYDCDQNSNIQELVCKNPKIFNLSIGRLIKPDLREWKQILSGNYSIAADSINFVKKVDDTEKRLDNINVTIKLIMDLLHFSNFLIVNNTVASNGNLAKLNEELQAIISLLTYKVKPKVSEINKMESSIITEINRYEYVKETRHHIGSTDDFNFKTRSKLIVVPDFGMIIISGSFPQIKTDLIYSPYLGFNVNFRPINKDIPFRLLKYKTIWHRLSLMSGITLTKLKIEGEREDLFANNSLMTGMGFRVGNFAKVALGGVWYKSLNSNPTISRSKPGVSPYAGVSLDLELQELFGGIANLFK